MSALQSEFHTSGHTDAGQQLDEFEAPSISPQDLAEHTAQRIAAAFEATKLVEIVEVKASLGQVHLMGRVHKDNEKDFMNTVIYPILRVVDGQTGIDLHACKQFFLKQGSLRYGWVVSFASDDLKTAAFKISEAIAPAIHKLEVTEAPLVGQQAPQSGGMRSGRRGAAPIGG